MHLQVLDSRKDLSIVHSTGTRGEWATSGRTIVTSSDGGKEWTRFGNFPRQLPQDLLGIGRLPRRLLRLDKANIWPSRSGRVLGIRGGQVWRYDDVPGRAPTALFEIEGDCVMNRAIAEDRQGYVYFGEYFMNPNRIPVKIWRIDPELKRWEIAYQFDQPRCRHVHAIHLDPFEDNRLWVTMGDFHNECYLAYSDDRFESLHFVGDGTQLWRSVGLLFKRDSIHWLTDTHIEQNHVMSLKRGTETGVVHGNLPASSWYLAETVEGLYLATTTVEPGPGIQTDRARLLASRDGLEWTTVIEFPKDRYPMRGFGFGSLSLPAGEISAASFWLSGEGLVGLDGGSLLCSIGFEH